MRLSTTLSAFIAVYFTTEVLATTTDDDFIEECRPFFYKKTPPAGFPEGYKYICQKFEGTYYFATLYDVSNRIPIYSAYKIDSVQCTGKQPSRRNSWYIEPQLFSSSEKEDMDKDLNVNDKKVMPVQATNDDYKDTNFDRGHLNPNFLHCGKKRTSTFTLTNSVPQDPCFNRIRWFAKEDKIQDEFRDRCNFSGSERYVITGAVPSEDDFIPQKDLIVEDMPDRVTERVNVPTHMWTAACCYTPPGSTGSSFFFGHIGENNPGGSDVEYTDLQGMTNKLNELYGYHSSLKLFADACSASDGVVG